MKVENAKYQRSLTEAERHLETAKSEKGKYEEANATLSQQIDEKEKRHKKLSRQLKNARAETDKNKKNLADTKKRLEKSEVAQTDYKQRLETISKELKVTKGEARTFEENLKTTSDQLEEAVDEWMASMESLTATRKLFTAATIGSQEIQKIFPPFETDSAVRILDRRGTDKRTYLLGLLEQKQPTIVYVQSEEKVDQLLTLVGPEKAEIIAKHSDQTSEAEETKILEKLGTDALVAIVSDTTFSTLTQSHRVEHFVFCHLVPGLDTFFERCQPAFTSEKDSYLHLIYESKQNVEDLAEKYPNEETLRKLYQKFRDRTPINMEFINPDNLYNELCKENELDITNLGIETGFSIFEELGFLEQNEEGIRRLSTPPRKLEESKIYCRGKKLKEEIANSPAFQHEHSIEQIWEKMLEELNIDSEQTLRESGIYSKHFKILEKDSDTQLTTKTEQAKITPPTPDVWPQRGISAFDALRQRAANNFATANTTLQTVNEPSTADLDWESPVFEAEELESPVFEDQEDYQNKYNLALQFAEEYGITALEEGIAQLIRDQNDPTYDFMEDERNMLRAFQDAFWNFRIQSKQFAEATENDSTIAKEDGEVDSAAKHARANAKVRSLTEIVRDILKELFTGQTVHRDEIYKRVLDVYRERGGKESDEIIKRRCRDALGDLSPSGTLSDRHGCTKYEGDGYWTILASL